MNIDSYVTKRADMPDDQKFLNDRHDFMAGYEKIGTEYKLFIEAIKVPSKIDPSCTNNFLYIQPQHSFQKLQETYHRITENLLTETGYYDNQSAGVPS